MSTDNFLHGKLHKYMCFFWIWIHKSVTPSFLPLAYYSFLMTDGLTSQTIKYKLQSSSPCIVAELSFYFLSGYSMYVY